MERTYMKRSKAIIAVFITMTAIGLLASCGSPGTESKVQPAATQPASTPASRTSPSVSPKPVRPSGGTIQVNSNPPGAAVLLISTDEGGAGMPEPKGTSPVTITGVTPGKYTVHLERSGYRYFQKEVTVKDGASVTVSANLKKG
jgi:hypothetical protein